MTMEPNQFVALHYAAKIIRDREERSRFVQLVKDRAPLSAYGDWPDFQEICQGEQRWL